MTDNLTITVIKALAYADGVAPDQLDYSLSEYVNPDVFSALDEQSDSAWELTFEAGDHDVSIDSDGIVLVDGVRFDGESVKHQYQ